LLPPAPARRLRKHDATQLPPKTLRIEETSR
jgi:hypothetical protein